MKLPAHLILACLLMALTACESNQGTDQQAATPAAATAAQAGITSAPVAEKATAPLPERGKYAIDLSSGNISIRANRVNELELFKAVADAAGFQLLTGRLRWKTVTVDIHTDTLHAAIVELVSAYPYEIVYAPGEADEEEVLTEVVLGKPRPGSPTDTPPNNPAADDPAWVKGIKELPEYERQLAYLEKLRDPSPETRAAAAKEIKPTADTLNVLTDMLANDPSPEVRVATTWSLEISDEAEAPQAIDALVKCLSDKDYNLVVECIDSLGFIGDETTIQYLLPYMTHEDEDVRKATVEAIRFLQ